MPGWRKPSSGPPVACTGMSINPTTALSADGEMSGTSRGGVASPAATGCTSPVEQPAQRVGGAELLESRRDGVAGVRLDVDLPAGRGGDLLEQHRQRPAVDVGGDLVAIGAPVEGALCGSAGAIEHRCERERCE